MIKFYKCECGKEFNNPQAFNGHKCHCKEHLVVANKYDKYLLLEQNRIKKLTITNRVKAKADLAAKKSNWIAEEHKCEHCGKVMTEKFGVGRFCSRACANSHKHSKETKQKISSGVKNSNIYQDNLKAVNNRKIEEVSKYNNNPNRCIICGKVLDYEHRKNLTCCKACQNKITQQQKLELCAKQGTNLCGKGLRGYYKGFYCQSSWELAYVIYQLEHNIDIKRNTKGFKYILDGIERSYFPDFYDVAANTYIEIKGYYDRKTKEKEKQFPKNEKLIIFREKEMKPILDYVISKYGKDFTKLYIKN